MTLVLAKAILFITKENEKYMKDITLRRLISDESSYEDDKHAMKLWPKLKKSPVMDAQSRQPTPTIICLPTRVTI